MGSNTGLSFRSENKILDVILPVHCPSETSSEILVHAFVSSRLDYCNSLFLACSKSVLDRLQKIPNAAARPILHAKRSDSATPILLQIHWLKIPERIEFKSCLTTYKCLNNLAPSYLADFCIPLKSVSLRNDLRFCCRRQTKCAEM